LRVDHRARRLIIDVTKLLRSLITYQTYDPKLLEDIV
jgi:hypothetical protein